MNYLYPRIVGKINDDHSLYIDVKNIPGKNQAVLIDCGNNSTLAVKDFIKISTVLISHAHIDHLIGFDNLIRMNLREEKRIRIIGPAPLSTLLHHRLRGYTWNLVSGSKFELEIWDIFPRIIKKFLLRCCEKFAKKHFLEKISSHNPLFSNKWYECSYIILEHGIPSIGYSLKEHDQMKVDKNQLSALMLPEGKWIQKLKTGDFSSGESIIIDGTTWNFKNLHEHLITIFPGFKVCYITDTICNKRLHKQIVRFIQGAHQFYCESSFLNKDAALAEKYYHLTAEQVGHLAKDAHVERLYLIHFSQRYTSPDVLLAEAKKVFSNTSFPHFPRHSRITRKV